MDLTPLFDDERVHPASDRQLRRAATEGRHADAGPVAQPLAFAAALLALRCTGPTALASLSGFTASSLESAGTGGLPDLTGLVSAFLLAVLTPALACLAVNTAARAALGNVLWAPARLMPDPARLFDAAGARAWAPVNLAANGVLGALRLSLLAAAGWMAWPGLNFGASLWQVESALVWLLLALAAAWLVAGVVEHAVLRLAFGASLRLTRREAAEDNRAAEGDGRVAARLRAKIEKRMMK